MQKSRITLGITGAHTTSVKTDMMGNYSVSLEPGHYIIYMQTGPLKSQMEPDNLIIKENQIIKKDLYIETGIR